ncbi:hypothetical protein EDD16DRAFT_1891433 [Pisolithus croceorrhizus]|nr:hypothetical protein EDD16DRAFT_1891433 [Pisolithus croceorrhizus]
MTDSPTDSQRLEPDARSRHANHSQPPSPLSDMITLSPIPQQDSPVAHLMGIFPDFDEAVIISVLESVNNDQDRALDVLLGMNDPTYVPATPPSTIQSQRPPQQQPGPTQEDLDEQLARRLAFEEEEAARAASSERQPRWGGLSPPQQNQQQANYQAYQPRRSNDRGSGSWSGWRTEQDRTSQYPGQGQRDTMAEFQEGFYKIAETGKKTFSTIVSKVKAKMQEFDQGGGPGSGSTSTNAYGAPDLGLQGTPSQGYTHSPSYSAGRTASPSWNGGQPRTNTYAPAPPIPPIDTRPDTRTRTPPAVRGYDLSDPAEGGVSPRTHTPPPPFPSENTTARSLGAEGEPLSSALPVSPDNALPGAFPLTSGNPPPFTSSSRSSTSGPGPVPISGPQGAGGTAPRSNVEFSKLGLLPKRPVSLVRPLSPPAAAAGGRNAPAQRKESSDDELEYVENPFEDRH